MDKSFGVEIPQIIAHRKPEEVDKEELNEVVFIHNDKKYVVRIWIQHDCSKSGFSKPERWVSVSAYEKDWQMTGQDFLLKSR